MRKTPGPFEEKKQWERNALSQTRHIRKKIPLPKKFWPVLTNCSLVRDWPKGKGLGHPGNEAFEQERQN
jgi:hypothetical protein